MKRLMKVIASEAKNKLPYTYDDVKTYVDILSQVALGLANTYWPCDKDNGRNFDIVTGSQCKKEVDRFVSLAFNRYGGDITYEPAYTDIAGEDTLYRIEYRVNFATMPEIYFSFAVWVRNRIDYTEEPSIKVGIDNYDELDLDHFTHQLNFIQLNNSNTKYRIDAPKGNWSYIKEYFGDPAPKSNIDTLDSKEYPLELDELLDFVDLQVYAAYDDPDDMIDDVAGNIEAGGWEIINQYRSMRNPYKFTISNGKQRAKFCVDFDKEYLGPDEGYAVSINSLYYE